MLSPNPKYRTIQTANMEAFVITYPTCCYLQSYIPSYDGSTTSSGGLTLILKPHLNHPVIQV